MAFIYANTFAAKTETVYGAAPTILGYGDGIYGDGLEVRYGTSRRSSVTPA
jgi:hypothetical protein